MNLHVYVRSPTSDDKEVLHKMLSAAQISDYILHDVSAEDINKAPIVDLALAIGQVCERMLHGKAKTVFTIPNLKQLKPDPKNTEHRKSAWEIIQRVKKILIGQETRESTNISWQHAVVYLPGGRKMCIYEENLPIDVDADVFISRTDSDLLLKLKEAFQAESVIIGKE